MPTPAQDAAPRRPYGLVRAPSILGLHPGGVERLPEALLREGLADALGIDGTAAIPSVEPDTPYDLHDAGRGPPGTPWIRNAAGIARFARRLADAVGAALDRGETPVVLGGDCSILLGPLLALQRRRRGEARHGLLSLDAHNDCYDPVPYPVGEAAAMDIALALGIGPPGLTHPDGVGRAGEACPLLRPGDVALLGTRDQEAGPPVGRAATPAGVLEVPLAEIRATGIGAALDRAMPRLLRPGTNGFWLHLDADVVDDAVMPAVDYRLPGGLGWGELEAVLRHAAGSGRMLGLDVTIYNPALDPGGEAGRGLARALARGLGGGVH